MSTAPASNSQQHMLARVLESLKEARQRLEQVDRAKREALAIIGMGCRFPGAADSPDSYWSLIAEARDAVIDVPRDRWPHEMFFGEDEAVGKMRFRQAGFVDGIGSFDAAFFGISPREAERMDPQQRMLLQVAWDAIDDAGLNVESLAGSRTGVWVGVNSHDYLNLQLRDTESIDTYTLVGGTSSIIANRLSYLLDLRGPSLAVDTACSTALVAVHLACQSLRSGECDLAIVGAVNLIISPFTTMAHVRGMPMAADYRCKTFDARADGYVRGEGCGVIVLRRASDAARNGDAVWAQIRGSAINQDGRTNGLTAPNGLSQQAVIREALAVASIAPESIGYIEAHGTGTSLGDPIEVEALQQVYGAKRTEACALGSVKPNIGHLEAAAGIAGLIKVALTLHHKQIPAVRGFEQINPHIDLDPSQFVVPTKLTSWDTAIRRAAVSSFGAGGTNAHVVLEQSSPLESGPAQVQPGSNAALSSLVLISSNDDEGLRRNAEAWSEWLGAKGDAVSFPEVASTSMRRRTWRDSRLIVRAADAAQLRQRLQGWLRGERDEDVAAARVLSGHTRRLVFVCPGQGSQWVGMARDLLAHEPAFRAAIERCDAAIAEHADWSLLARLRDSSPFSRIDVIQPTLWAVTVALAEQWKQWGIRPDAVIGHSMGEIAAATIAGALSWSDAALTICRRSRILLQAAGKGLMLLVGQSPAEVEQYLHSVRDRASIAVSNSPGSAVVSGDHHAIEQVEKQLIAANVFHRRIAVDVASHSPQMDPLAAELRSALADVKPRLPEMAMLSTVDLLPVESARLDADYWVRNLRDPVRFGDATALLLAQGHDVFVELSPHPILCTAMEQTIESVTRTSPVSCVVLPSMIRDHDGLETMQRAAANLLANGHEVDVKALLPDTGSVQRLPAYQWSQREFWFCEDRWAALRAMGAESTTTSPVQRVLRGASYRLDWIPRAGTHAKPGGRPWFVIGAEQELARAFEQAFEALGVFAVCLAELPPASDSRWTTESPAGVLDLRAPGPGISGASAAANGSAVLLAALQLLRKVHGCTPRLWTLTRGAQDAEGSAPAAAALWGLGRAAAIEQPTNWGGLFDVPARAPLRERVGEIVAALLVNDGEDQLRLDSDGQVRVARIIADPEIALAAEGFRCDETSSLLVAGPRGRAVITMLRALRDRGAKTLLWLEQGTALSSAPADLELPTGVQHITASQLPSSLAQCARDGAPVFGAVVLPSAPAACALRDLDAAGVAETFRCDATAVDTLLHSLAAQSLRELVVISSVAGSWGSMAMGHVGASAAYIDALVRSHRGDGCAYAVLESTPWAECDMIDAGAALEAARMGVAALDPATAIAAALRVTSCSTGSHAVADIEWSRLRSAYEVNRPRPVLGTLGNSVAVSLDENSFLDELRELVPRERITRLHGYLSDIVATLLRHSPDAIGLDTGFFQLGMDSIMAMELRRRLAAAMKQPVPASMIFEHPTVARLSKYVLERVGLVEIALAPTIADQRADEARQMLADAAAMSEQALLDALAQELE
jgi:myxalamid-type polyketide synthase MxaC